MTRFSLSVRALIVLGFAAGAVLASGLGQADEPVPRDNREAAGRRKPDEEPRPDYPGAAAKFHRLRTQVDAKGTVPANALPRAIARVNAMRQQVPALPKTANVVFHAQAVANPAIGVPYRVAGMPVGFSVPAGTSTGGIFSTRAMRSSTSRTAVKYSSSLR